MLKPTEQIVYFTDFGLIRAPATPVYVSPVERAAFRALVIIESQNLGLSAEKATELATSIAAGIAPDTDWADIERLMSGDYSLCDGYCHSDGY